MSQKEHFFVLNEHYKIKVCKWCGCMWRSANKLPQTECRGYKKEPRTDVPGQPPEPKVELIDAEKAKKKKR